MHGGDVVRLADAEGVVRGTVYGVRAGGPRIPRSKTLEAITSAPDTRHLLRRRASAAPPEVNQ